MRHWIIAAVLLSISPAAYAQIGNPAGMIAGTQMAKPGVPAPGQPNNTDRLFARLLTAGGKAEVDFGQLSSDRAISDSVQEFAARMVEDHGATNERLAALADAAGIPLPDELTPDHQRMRQELEAAEGDAYDLAYISGQIVEHQKAVQLLEWEIGQGQEGDLQRFAAETLPTPASSPPAAEEAPASSPPADNTRD
jgi:putative membrane protein